MISIEQAAAQMTNTAQSIRYLVEGVSDEQARRRPDDESWSLLEVINHLDDEEREDFRVRLDHILHTPDQPFPTIDPQGWVRERKYNERELEKSLNNFLHEREQSLAWLRGLDAPNWEAAYEAPWGIIKAGDMLSAWVAHDLLHLRQLVEIRYAYTVHQAQPYEPGYAGEW